MSPDRPETPLGPSMARFVATHLGLSFPPEREAELLRGLQGAARNAGFDSAARYSEWLLSHAPLPATLHQLAAHLTVGETYFYREEQALRALSQHILPRLIAARRGNAQHLRLWSAACSTGEEAYSLAIMLRELLPDWDDWRLTLLATDINPYSLEKAAAGVFGEWSFRTLPPDLRARYFTPTQDRRFAISETIKRRVTFAQANLAADTAPEFPSEASAMDVVLCRNLLIYFTAEQGKKLVARLHSALAPGGCLAVSPSEFSQYLFSRFDTLDFPGTMLYRRPVGNERPAGKPRIRKPASGVVLPATPPAPTQAVQPAVAPPARRVVATLETPAPLTREDYATRARSLANLGRLSDALGPCEEWIKADKVDPAAHYLHATVLMELGDRDGARRSLRRCIYLQPDFALAHFALGNLARGGGQHDESQRHYRNAQRLLEAQPQDAALPESEGLTAGRVAAIVRSLLQPDHPEITPAGNKHAVH